MSSHDAMAVTSPSQLDDTGSDWPELSASKPSGKPPADDHLTVAGSDDPRPSHAAIRGELSPGTTLHRYMILSRLGSGAMGVVYAAYDPDLDRKIALKLLHPRGGSNLDSKVRLMREAKALARLSHPNVVAVHDVGTFGDRVFLAMEFIDGKTLSAWLKEQPAPRPWRDVLALMRKAGEGLAAAHLAGLIHRDFKPDNVLIAHDGRVRVLDFGLARASSEISHEDLERDPAAAAVLASVSSERRERSQVEDAMLTRTGALVGTPAYMSPEQHLGQDTDHRSDQFSFCVALHQALYGTRPFVGERMSSLTFQVLQGKVGAAPAGTTVPTWLRRIILRGLSVEPALRYPGMPELLADLDRHIGGGKRRRGLLLASAGIIGLGLWLGLRATAGAPPLCRSALVHLHGTWDEARTVALEAAFRTSNLPYAAATWASVRPTLELYARRWALTHTDACEATRIRGEQSELILDQRMACLERRRIELFALTEVFLSGETTAIENASEGVSRLGDIAACDDLDALTAIVAPPTGPLAAAVLRVNEEVARASALDLAARWTDALRLTTAAIADPAALDYPPLQAAALRVHARVQRHLGAHADAALSLQAATQAAARGRDDRAAADAWIDLLYIAGADLNRPELTHAYSLAADDAVLRSGDDPLLRARVDATIFGAQIRLGTPDLAAGQRALAYFAADPDADPNVYHRLLNGLAVVHRDRREFAKARELYERARAFGTRHYGSDHPSNGAIFSNLAVLAIDEGRLDDARGFADQAAAARRLLPADHIDHADTEECYANIAATRGDDLRATDHYRRALAIYQSSKYPPPAKLAALHNNLAIFADIAGRHRDAIPEYRAALTAFRAFAPDGEHTITVEENLAQALLNIGEHNEAKPLQDHVVEQLQARHGRQNPIAAAARVPQAQILRTLGQPSEAGAILEAALPTLEQAGPEYRGRRGLARYILARCLDDLHTDRPRQRSLLALAAVDLGDDSEDPTSQRALAELQSWSSNAPPRPARTR